MRLWPIPFIRRQRGRKPDPRQAILPMDTPEAELRRRERAAREIREGDA